MNVGLQRCPLSFVVVPDVGEGGGEEDEEDGGGVAGPSGRQPWGIHLEATPE